MGRRKSFDPKFAPVNYEGAARVNVGLRDTKWDQVQAALLHAREDYPGQMDRMREKLIDVRQRWPEHFQSVAVSMLLWSARFETAPTPQMQVSVGEELPW